MFVTLRIFTNQTKSEKESQFHFNLLCLNVCLTVYVLCDTSPFAKVRSLFYTGNSGECRLYTGSAVRHTRTLPQGRVMLGHTYNTDLSAEVFLDAGASLVLSF